ncbi:unnamed protein product [Urochloa humidicola]
MASARDGSPAAGDSPGDAPRTADEPPSAPPSHADYPRLASPTPPLLPSPADLAPRFVALGATVPLPVQGLRYWSLRTSPALRQRLQSGPRRRPCAPPGGAPHFPSRGKDKRDLHQQRTRSPGAFFPEVLLARFFCLAAPSRNWDMASTSCLVWIVPSPEARAATANLDCLAIADILSSVFSVHPVRFEVRSEGPGVFVTATASRSVAHFIALQGFCSSGSTRLALFPCISLATAFLGSAVAGGDAEGACSAKRLEIQIPDSPVGPNNGPLPGPFSAHEMENALSSPVAPLPPVTAVSLATTALNSPCTPPPASSALQLSSQSLALECSGDHEIFELSAVRISLGGSGLETADPHLHGAGDVPAHSSYCAAAALKPALSAPLSTDASSAVPSPHASHPRAARPYLLALLSPPRPPLKAAARPRPRRALSLPPSRSQCFRCLGTDHLVAQCREPERCRLCFRFGHRSATCPSMSGSSSRFLWERMSGRRSRSPSADSGGSPPPPSAWSSAARSAWRSPTIDRRGDRSRSQSPVLRERSRSPVVRFAAEPESVSFRRHASWRVATPYPAMVTPSSAGSSRRRDSMEVHAPPVDLVPSKRYAYAFIDPPCAFPARFIRRALERCGGDPPFRLAPSSYGAMMVVFLHPFLRERTIGRGPITYPTFGETTYTLRLIRHEEADFRFICHYKRLVEISVTKFPPEHWNEPHIRSIFEKVGHVCCIDPACLLVVDDRYPDDIADFSSVRLLLLVDHESLVPFELVVRNEEGGLAGIAQIRVVSHWAHTPGTPPPRHHVFTNDGVPGGPARDVDNTPGAFCSAPFSSSGVGGPGSTRPAGGSGNPCRDLGLGSCRSLAPDACSSSRARIPVLEVRDLPTPVRPRSPPPTSFDHTALVDQDIVESGLRAARSQPRSSLPSLQDLIAEEEHEVSARRRRARRKRVVDSACKRRSSRLAEKESAHYVSATDRATSVKAAKLDLSAASSSMAAATKASGILQRPPPRRTAIRHLRRLGAACGISDLSALTEVEEPAAV